MNTENKIYITANEFAQILDVSLKKVYEIIEWLNI